MTKRHGEEPSQRQLRVGEELRHALVRILARGHLRDPALTDAQVTVTEVRIGPDLRSATAYVVPFAGGDRETVVSALNRAAGFLRAQLAHEVRLRYAPDVKFAIDDSFDQARRIDELLHDPRVAKDLTGDSTAQKHGDPGTEDGDA